jgi:BirA family biotin operon repressor/biotin-[acetyl-CoA-carboxylase] ligase
MESRLTTETLGRPMRTYPVAVSVEALAGAWARQEQAPEGATVVASQELGARGRRGTVWKTIPDRSLSFAVVLRPALPPAGEQLLWILASLAAGEGLDKLGVAEARLKWPDYIYVGGGKLGVIRVQAHLGPGQIDSAVLTFRLNLSVTPDDVPDASPASVAGATGGTVAPSAVIDAVLRALEGRYNGAVEPLLAAYRARCSTLGARVRAELLPKGEVEGVAKTINDQGSLEVEVHRGGVRPVTVETLRRLHVIG